MSKSSLAKISVPADKSNYTPGRFVDYYEAAERGEKPKNERKVSTVTIHHMAGVSSAESCGYGFQNPNRNGSAHYGIGNNGDIANYVKEEDTAWANSNWESNCEAITIEVSNSKYGDKYGWPVSDDALKSLIKLVADILKRYNLGKAVKGKNVTWHNMFAATQCPGAYILSKMDYIIAEVNKLMVDDAPKKPDPTKWEYPYSVNSTRATDSLVLYSEKSSSGTNKYGTEMLLNADGVILNIESNKGNMLLEGKRVLSGHGDAAKWMSKLKIGNHVYFKDDKCYADNGTYKAITGIDRERRTNDLIKYTRRFINNPYGRMVAVSKDGIALTDPIYGIATMDIPDGGYVLSGHGTNSEWLKANVKKGTKIKLFGTTSIKLA